MAKGYTAPKGPKEPRPSPSPSPAASLLKGAKAVKSVKLDKGAASRLGKKTT